MTPLNEPRAQAGDDFASGRTGQESWQVVFPLAGNVEFHVRAACAAMDSRHMAAVLFEAENPALAFAQYAAAAAVAGFMYLEGRPLAWALAHAPGQAMRRAGAKTGFVHIGCTAAHAAISQGAEIFLERCFRSFELLLAAVPGCYVGAKKLLGQCGFAKILEMPKGLWLARQKRLASGAVWALDRTRWLQDREAEYGKPSAGFAF